jgi:hypothetical protein
MQLQLPPQRNQPPNIKKMSSTPEPNNTKGNIGNIIPDDISELRPRLLPPM